MRLRYIQPIQSDSVVIASKVKKKTNLLKWYLAVAVQNHASDGSVRGYILPERAIKNQEHIP